MIDSYIPNRIAELSETVNKLKLKQQTVRSSLRSAQTSYREIKEQRQSIEHAVSIIQNISQTIQQQIHSRIDSVVTHCLKSVFNEPYDFHIIFEKKRNKTEARLVFRRDGEEFEPLSSTGGGCVDVAAFALRLSCLMLKPETRPVIILDEPFKSPSPHYRSLIKRLIETLAEDLNVQFIYVTNILELKTGKVIDLDVMKALPRLTSGDYASTR